MDFDISEFSAATVLFNYEIYKRVKKFLDDSSVPVVSAVEGHTNVFEIVLFTIWPEDDYSNDRRQAYLRMLDVRAAAQGRGTYANMLSEANNIIDPNPTISQGDQGEVENCASLSPPNVLTADSAMIRQANAPYSPHPDYHPRDAAFNISRSKIPRYAP